MNVLHNIAYSNQDGLVKNRQQEESVIRIFLIPSLNVVLYSILSYTK